jgi:hypothetical protein
MKIVGYLKKKKTTGFLKNLFGKTNLRFFECSFSQETFGYKKSEKDTQFLKVYNFSDLRGVSNTVSQEDLKNSDWKHGFKLNIQNNIVILFAKDEEEKKNWLIAFENVLEINKYQIKESNKDYIDTEDKKIRHDKSNFIKNAITYNSLKSNDKKMAIKGKENFKKFLNNLNLDENAENKEDYNQITKPEEKKNNEESSLNFSYILESSHKDLKVGVDGFYETIKKNNVELFPNADDLNCWDMYDTKGNQINKKIPTKEKKPESIENLNFNEYVVDEEKEKQKRRRFLAGEPDLSNTSKLSISNSQPSHKEPPRDHELDKKIKIDAKKFLVDSIKILNNYQERNSYTAAKNLKEIINNQQYSNNFSRDSNKYEVIGAVDTTIEYVNKSYKFPAHHQEYIPPEKISDKDIYGNVDESVINFFMNNVKATENENKDESRLTEKIEFENELIREEEDRKKRAEKIFKDSFNFDDDKNFVLSKIKKKSEIARVADEIRSDPNYFKKNRKEERNKNLESAYDDVSVEFRVKTGKVVRNEFLEDWN